MNKSLFAYRQLNCVYPEFHGSPLQKLGKHPDALHLHGHAGKKGPVGTNENRVFITTHEHPKTMKTPEMHDHSEMLWNVERAACGTTIDRLADKFAFGESNQHTKFFRHSLEFSFET